MTNVHAVHDDNDEPTDPYDLGRLRYSEAEYTHGDVDAEKRVTTIRVRKPFNNKEWFQLHPGREYQWPVALYLRETDESVKPETYLVLPEFAPLFRKGLTPVRLRLAVNSLGTPFLGDMKVPTDGRMDEYYATLQEIAEEAEKGWIKLDWNSANRVYDYWSSKGDLGDPQFPQKTMRDLVALGFKGDRLVDRQDHPLIAEFEGRRA